METRISRNINASPETVFRYIDEEDKIKLWIPELVANEFPHGKPKENPVGTKFIQKLKEGGRVRSYEGEVTAYEKNRALSIRLGNKGFTVDVDYRVEPQGSGSRLDFTCKVQYKSWFFGLMGKLFSGFMVKVANKQMDQLKEAAEQGK